MIHSRLKQEEYIVPKFYFHIISNATKKQFLIHEMKFPV